MSEHQRKYGKAVATGRILRFSTLEQEQSVIEERRKFAFLAANKGSSWLRTAERHKRAADILYEVAHAANEREMARARKEFKQTQAKMRKQGLSLCLTIELSKP